MSKYVYLQSNCFLGYLLRLLQRTVTDYIKNIVDEKDHIVICGLQAVGKLTSIENIKPNINHISLDNIKTLLLAHNNKKDFFEDNKPPLILSSVEQLESVVEEVAKINNKVILLSSRNIYHKKKYKKYYNNFIKINLYGLSIYELANMGHMQKPFIPSSRPSCIISKKSSAFTFKQIWKGFFPEICREEKDDIWDEKISKIIENIIQKDIIEYINFSNKIVFYKFLEMLMTYIGKEINVKEIAEKLSIAPNTIKSWLFLLEEINFIYLLQPYYMDNSRRYIKAPKLYVTDTSLASWLLSLKSGVEIEDSIYKDMFFENFVVMEIIKSYKHNGKDNKFYHYRDNLKIKIDLLIEDDECFYPINIKNTINVDESMVKSFEKAKLHKNLGYGGLICLVDMYKTLNTNASAISIWEI